MQTMRMKHVTVTNLVYCPENDGYVTWDGLAHYSIAGCVKQDIGERQRMGNRGENLGWDVVTKFQIIYEFARDKGPIGGVGFLNPKLMGVTAVGGAPYYPIEMLW
jgi:hypothetical protein